MKYRVVGVRMIDEDLVYVTLEAMVNRDEPIVAIDETPDGFAKALMGTVCAVMDKFYNTGLYASVIMTLDEFQSSDIEVGSVVDLSLKLAGGGE